MKEQKNSKFSGLMKTLQQRNVKMKDAINKLRLGTGADLFLTAMTKVIVAEPLTPEEKEIYDFVAKNSPGTITQLFNECDNPDAAEIRFIRKNGAEKTKALDHDAMMKSINAELDADEEKEASKGRQAGGRPAEE